MKRRKLRTPKELIDQTPPPSKESTQLTAPVSLFLGNTPNKSGIVEEEVVDLGDYYFNKICKVVVKKTPKKKKLDYTGKEVKVVEPNKDG
jgi:hypothetical protein